MRPYADIRQRWNARHHHRHRMLHLGLHRRRHVGSIGFGALQQQFVVHAVDQK